MHERYPYALTRRRPRTRVRDRHLRARVLSRASSSGDGRSPHGPKKALQIACFSWCGVGNSLVIGGDLRERRVTMTRTTTKDRRRRRPRRQDEGESPRKRAPRELDED